MTYCIEKKDNLVMLKIWFKSVTWYESYFIFPVFMNFCRTLYIKLCIQYIYMSTHETKWETSYSSISNLSGTTKKQKPFEVFSHIFHLLMRIYLSKFPREFNIQQILFSQTNLFVLCYNFCSPRLRKYCKLQDVFLF